APCQPEPRPGLADARSAPRGGRDSARHGCRAGCRAADGTDPRDLLADRRHVATRARADGGVAVTRGGEASDGLFKNATIVGLGLIGGSIARDLAAKGVRVRGYDADREQLDAAVRDGIVSDPLDLDFDGAGADVIVLAVPVDHAPVMLRRLARVARAARLVTDVGSTKTSIVNEARALGLDGCFVGSHPMAGDHRSGWTASRRNLFADALVYVCPTSSPRTAVVEVAKHFWQWLGARPCLMDADAHDKHVAWSSHLPHLVSMALGLALDGAGVERESLGPGGRDATRLAGSSPEMWTAIAADNH